jgi:Domain of unknown function (DUF4188)
MEQPQDQPMHDIRAERLTAAIDGDFVVFLIGMRIHRLWKVHKWLPVAQSMPRMLLELEREPHSGLLHARTHFGLRNVLVVQYWRSFDALQAYATAHDKAHLPAWQAFNRNISSNNDVGIWHETYLVRAGEHESLYYNMPPYGLGQASTLTPATGARASARQRLNRD